MKDNCNEAGAYRFAERLANAGLAIFAVCSIQVAVPAFAQAPKPPACHLTRDGPQCGLMSFRCRPFSILDHISVQGFDIQLQGIDPKTGVINAQYFGPGLADIRICATIDFVTTSCGKPISVTFPDPFCPPRGGGGGGGGGGRGDGPPCKITDPECHPK